MIVVDTNVLVDVLCGVPAAVAVLERNADDIVVVPSMVRFEILAGARPSEMNTILGLLDACVDGPADSAVATVDNTAIRMRDRRATICDLRCPE